LKLYIIISDLKKNDEENIFIEEEIDLLINKCSLVGTEID
jgi:hypothetical protein